MGERFKVSQWGEEWRVLHDGRVMASFRGADAKAQAEARARDYEGYLREVEHSRDEGAIAASDTDEGSGE